MLSLLVAMAAVSAAPEPALLPGLQPLAFLVGHCWRGQVAGRDEVDVHCFEAVWGGKHVRDRHEVNVGSTVYKGETLYSWDGEQKRVDYTYWNSLGGVRRGSMAAREDRLDFADDKGAPRAVWHKSAPNSYRAESLVGEGPPRAVVFIRTD